MSCNDAMFIFLMSWYEVVSKLNYNYRRYFVYVKKLEYRVIRKDKCLVATGQINFGDRIPGHEEYPSLVEMTVSNKWEKLLNLLVRMKLIKHNTQERWSCGRAVKTSFS